MALLIRSLTVKKWIQISLLVLVLLGILVWAVQQTQWQHVYTSGFGGEPRYGSLQTLLAAVQAGKDVKVEVDQGSGYLIYLPAESVWTRGSHVYAMNTSVIGVVTQPDSYRFNPDAYHWYILVSTKGKLDLIRFAVGSGESRGHDESRAKVRWFVR
jgi:hypothetical protein